MHRTIRFRLWAGVAALAVTGAMGCSSDSSSPSTPAVTAALADSLGEAVVGDINLGVAGATSTGADASFQASAGIALTPPSFACSVTRTPDSPANSDGDPVPDSVRFAFSNCVFTLPAESDTLKGTIDFIDPTPDVTDRSIERKFTDYGWVQVRNASGRMTSVILDGTRRASRDSSSLTQTDSGMVTTYTFGNGSTATHTRTWSFQFTADSANTVLPDSALPAGTWTVNGNSTWTRGAATFNLLVSTPTPLHHDPACTAIPTFDAGTLRIDVTRAGGGTSTVTIQFTGCGSYTVTRT